MEYHEFASVFPLMAGDDLDALVEDIKSNGLREPIMRFGGKILDGRNRHVACTMAGVKPIYRDFSGTSAEALAFVWSENFHRRDLSPGQRAACIVDREELEAKLKADAKQRHKAAGDRGKEGGRGKKKTPTQKVGDGLRDHSGETDAQLAAAAGTNRQYVADMRKIKRDAPEEHDAVKRGAKRVSEAKRDIQRKQKRAELEAAADAAAANPVNWRVIVDDCMNSLGELEDSIAQLVFADPPYNIGIDYGHGKSADLLSDGDYMLWVRRWLAECVRILSPTGTLWVMIGDEYADLYGVALRGLGVHRRAWVKWYETFGVNCTNSFNRCSRHLFYCVKNLKRFTFNRDAVSRPSDRQTKYADKRADPSGKTWDDVWQIPRLVGTAAERIPDFPTQIPLAITRAIVGACSMPGELVVDPFSGSGSTGVACIELGRRYIGIEKNERYAELSQKRLMVAQDEVCRAETPDSDKQTRDAG